MMQLQPTSTAFPAQYMAWCIHAGEQIDSTVMVPKAVFDIDLNRNYCYILRHVAWTTCRSFQEMVAL